MITEIPDLFNAFDVSSICYHGKIHFIVWNNSLFMTLTLWNRVCISLYFMLLLCFGVEFRYFTSLINSSIKFRIHPLRKLFSSMQLENTRDHLNYSFWFLHANMATFLWFCFLCIFRILSSRLLFSFLLPFSHQSKKGKSDPLMTLSISFSSSPSATESFSQPPGIQQIWLTMENGVRWLPPWFSPK